MTEPRADLLVELGCEELPPKALPVLARAFFDQVRADLGAAGIGFDSGASHCWYTPRRMTLYLGAVADRQPDQVQERLGPARQAAFDAEGRPTPAALGFARSVGRTLEELEWRDAGKGERLFCRLESPGKPLAELIFPILAAALERLPVPRPMRWADHEFSFVRPVHWLVVLHGDQVLDGELYACRAGRETRGHRIHAPEPISLDRAGDYLGRLREARVEADPARRVARIRAQAETAGREAGGETRITDALLEEVSNLLEWPVALGCRFEEAFLDVPQEALIASMEGHQKFFPVLDGQSGRLCPAFVAMANLESQDPAAVREGFERVVRPRLADARFFWEQDLKTPLDERLGQLDNVVFQQKLGTVGDKSRRLASFSEKLAGEFSDASGQAPRAALLAKCDLVTQMVGEFPELQGTMGGHYARAAGEAPEVATAIGEHYLPRHAGDRLPATPAGRLVAVADRMDTLVGIFAAGLRPTGNKDPYALRRAALGVLRILLEAELPVAPDRLIDIAAEGLPDTVDAGPALRAEVREFLIERLRHWLREQGYSANQVHSVLSAPLGSLPDLAARLAATTAFMQRPEAQSLVAANKRIGNILKQQTGEAKAEIDEDRFVSPQERQLFDDVSRVKALVLPRFEQARYDEALAELASLKAPVDAYFDAVMVMDEDLDLRRNRLAQLAELKALFDRVADFSQID